MTGWSVRIEEITTLWQNICSQYSEQLVGGDAYCSRTTRPPQLYCNGQWRNLTSRTAEGRECWVFQARDTVSAVYISAEPRHTSARLHLDCISTIVEIPRLRGG